VARLILDEVKSVVLALKDLLHSRRLRVLTAVP
jgi:hypothetical protein